MNSNVSCPHTLLKQCWYVCACNKPKISYAALQATAESPGMFRCIEELLAIDNCPCLESIIQAAQPHLSCVCDVKEAGGDMYYRLNDRRVRLVLSLLLLVLCALPCVVQLVFACCSAPNNISRTESPAMFDVSEGCLLVLD